jgi:hypothetical protein
MSWLATALQAISALTGLGRATSRLIEAAKASEPPPPEPAPPAPLRSAAPDALSYIEGRTDEQHRQWMREQQQKARATDDGEAERPVDDGGTPP